MSFRLFDRYSYNYATGYSDKYMIVKGPNSTYNPGWFTGTTIVDPEMEAHATHTSFLYWAIAKCAWHDRIHGHETRAVLDCIPGLPADITDALPVRMLEIPLVGTSTPPTPASSSSGKDGSTRLPCG